MYPKKNQIYLCVVTICINYSDKICFELVHLCVEGVFFDSTQGHSSEVFQFFNIFEIIMHTGLCQLAEEPKIQKVEVWRIR